VEEGYATVSERPHVCQVKKVDVEASQAVEHVSIAPEAGRAGLRGREREEERGLKAFVKEREVGKTVHAYAVT
jgi:hypothetical protein